MSHVVNMTLSCCKKYYDKAPFVFVESASKHVFVGKEVKQV